MKPIALLALVLVGVVAAAACGGSSGTPMSGGITGGVVVESLGIVTTVAGNGNDDLGGDGGPAIAAMLSVPKDVAVDTQGNIFIADTGNHRVRRVDATTGMIATFAGSINDEGFWAGDGGDGGPATEAQLTSPEGVAVDREGNLFIADRSNHRIRRVDGATGMISTVAGTGESADYVQGKFGGDGGLATEAQLNSPMSVAIDTEGNLFIADTWNNRIRRVDAETGIITTIAGSGTVAWYSGDGGPGTEAQLAFPHRIAVDSQGNVFVADTANNRVRRIDADTGIITTVVGGGANVYAGGLAVEAYVPTPTAVAVDGAGNLLVTDIVADRILRVDAETGIIKPLIGNGKEGFNGDGVPAMEALLGDPWSITVDGHGNLIFTERANHRVRIVRPKT